MQVSSFLRQSNWDYSKIPEKNSSEAEDTVHSVRNPQSLLHRHLGQRSSTSQQACFAKVLVFFTKELSKFLLTKLDLFSHPITTMPDSYRHASSRRWAVLLPYLVFICGFVMANSFQSYSYVSSSGQHLASSIKSTTLLPSSTANEPSSFRRRMLDRFQKTARPNIKKQGRPSFHLVQEVTSLEEFKEVVEKHSPEQLVVVWFYAPWCRACKATARGVFALSKNFHPSVKFVQVPVTPQNTNLHQGLGVPCVPFGQVYHPTVGLVEERKFSRRYLPGWNRLLQDYRQEECSLVSIDKTTQKEIWSCRSPYEPLEKAKDLHAGSVLQ